MGGMTDAALSLKAEVEAAVLAQIERLGPNGFSRAPIIKQFQGRAPTPTLYRWVDRIVKSGRPGQRTRQDPVTLDRRGEGPRVPELDRAGEPEHRGEDQVSGRREKHHHETLAHAM